MTTLTLSVSGQSEAGFCDHSGREKNVGQTALYHTQWQSPITHQHDKTEECVQWKAPPTELLSEQICFQEPSDSLMLHLGDDNVGFYFLLQNN